MPAQPTSRLIASLGLGIVAVSFATATAKEAHTSFTVSVTVNAVAQIDSLSAPSALQVTAEDLQRGYVEVPQPTALSIHSNSPNGYALDVMTLAPIVQSMVISGLDSSLRLGAEGGTIIQRWHAPQAVRLSLHFRFSLSPGLYPGLYPWPMRVSVRPLESV